MSFSSLEPGPHPANEQMNKGIHLLTNDTGKGEQPADPAQVGVLDNPREQR